MSNSEQCRHDQDEAQAESPNVGDLKSLLNTIVAQLSDADKRHSASLEDLQARVSAMGKDARSIRDRVPPHFIPAFEHIEAGVNEIADRLAEVTAEAHSPMAKSDSEPPAPLRSARSTTETGSMKRADEGARDKMSVDPFDVIGSSLPGNVTEPWDRAAAEALSSHYESAGFSRSPATPRAPRSDGEQLIDPAWLDERFASIAKGIEQSLSGVRPDRGFEALGHRFDQFEQQFTALAGSVATQSDLDALRLVEAQVGEVASQLLRAQDQLARLGSIEDQLAMISAALAEVHQAAMSVTDGDRAGSVQAQAQLDTSAIAHAAAERAAMRVASLVQSSQSGAGDADLRPLIEQFMSESRQGEENTTALLDTMQQAMIRLLDRVDAIEFAQHQSTAAAPAPQEYVREQVRFADHGRSAPAQFAEGSDDAIDAAVAAVATAKSFSTPVEPVFDVDQPPLARSKAPERSRQDFIAEARRAKLRLAAIESESEAIVVPAPASVTAEPPLRPTSPLPPRSVRPSPAATAAKTAGPSAPAPRIIVMAVAALFALGGLWFSLGSEKPSSVKPVALTPAASQGAAAGYESKKEGGQAFDSPKVTESNGQQSGGLGPRSDATPSVAASGSKVASATTQAAGRTTLPMTGVAVDLDRPMSADDLDQARRHEAMASMSGALGVAAARASTGMPTPAVLLPNEDTVAVTPSSLSSRNVGRTALQKASQGNTASTRTEMPAATVGPLSLRLAAANGDPSAQFEVGSRFAEGKGTQQNYKEAAKWYQRAADQNSPQAQYRLGTLYERGLGVRASAAQAAVWYQRAAEQGNIKAMHNLAVLSANQSDQSPDYITASQWFEKAAERGLADSQFNLAILYENGLGVKADMKKAYMWLSLAARGGDKEAVKRRDIIRGKMTADDLRAADKMLAGWRAIPLDKSVNDSRLAGEAWKKNPKNGISG